MGQNFVTSSEVEKILMNITFLKNVHYIAIYW